MDITTKIQNIINDSLADLGYELVRVSLQGGDIKTVQIMAERVDRVPMTIKDCTLVSRTASALLDVDDPFNGKYMLEVSSPGVDRPLVKEADYTRFVGKTAKIETLHDINGRKRFKGVIKEYDIITKRVHFEFENQLIQIAFDEIAKAKLLLTDSIMEKQEKK